MSPVRKFKNAKATEEAVESLHINRNTGKIAFRLVNYKYRDKDTRQMVIYFPSLELSGYGESEEKAEEMALFSIDEYFKYLIKLAPGTMDKELSVVGWKQRNIK